MEAEQDDNMRVPVPPSTMRQDSKLARSFSNDSGGFAPGIHGVCVLRCTRVSHTTYAHFVAMLGI